MATHPALFLGCSVLKLQPHLPPQGASYHSGVMLVLVPAYHTLILPPAGRPCHMVNKLRLQYQQSTLQPDFWAYPQ